MRTIDHSLSLNELIAAQIRLSWFVRAEALRTAGELGFGWRPAELAPSGLDELSAEFRACHLSGLPMRVYRHHSDDTVYDTAATNWAFRFWHDTRHVWIGADFSTEAELEVASCHLSRAKAEGLAAESLEYALLLADTVGQTLYVARTQRFVVHQQQFALECILADFDQAVELELSRQTPDSATP